MPICQRVVSLRDVYLYDTMSTTQRRNDFLIKPLQSKHGAKNPPTTLVCRLLNNLLCVTRFAVILIAVITRGDSTPTSVGPFYDRPTYSTQMCH